MQELELQELHYTSTNALGRSRRPGFDAVAWSEELTEQHIRELGLISIYSFPPSSWKGSQPLIYGLYHLDQDYIALSCIHLTERRDHAGRGGIPYARHIIVPQADLHAINYDVFSLLADENLFSPEPAAFPASFPPRRLHYRPAISQKSTPQISEEMLAMLIETLLDTSSSKRTACIYLDTPDTARPLLALAWEALPLPSRANLTFRTLMDNPRQAKARWDVLCFVKGPGSASPVRDGLVIDTTRPRSKDQPATTYAMDAARSLLKQSFAAVAAQRKPIDRLRFTLNSKTIAPVWTISQAIQSLEQRMDLEVLKQADEQLVELSRSRIDETWFWESAAILIALPFPDHQFDKLMQHILALHPLTTRNEAFRDSWQRSLTHCITRVVDNLDQATFEVIVGLIDTHERTGKKPTGTLEEAALTIWRTVVQSLRDIGRWDVLSIILPHLMQKAAHEKQAERFAQIVFKTIPDWLNPWEQGDRIYQALIESIQTGRYAALLSAHTCAYAASHLSPQHQRRYYHDFVQHLQSCQEPELLDIFSFVRSAGYGPLYAATFTTLVAREFESARAQPLLKQARNLLAPKTQRLAELFETFARDIQGTPSLLVSGQFVQLASTLTSMEPVPSFDRLYDLLVSIREVPWLTEATALELRFVCSVMVFATERSTGQDEWAEVVATANPYIRQIARDLPHDIARFVHHTFTHRNTRDAGETRLVLWLFDLLGKSCNVQDLVLSYLRWFLKNDTTEEELATFFIEFHHYARYTEMQGQALNLVIQSTPMLDLAKVGNHIAISFARNWQQIPDLKTLPDFLNIIRGHLKPMTGER